MYFVSILRMIFRQSLGLLVIYPKTLLFRLLPVSEQVISMISVLMRLSLSWSNSKRTPYCSICPSLTFLSIGLAIRSMSLASNNCSSILSTSWSMFSSYVSSLPFFFLRRLDCFFLSFSIEQYNYQLLLHLSYTYTLTQSNLHKKILCIDYFFFMEIIIVY